MTNTKPQPTRAQLLALRRAAARPTGRICPLHLTGGSHDVFLLALARMGWSDGKPSPRITDEGRAVIAAAKEKTQ